MFQVYKFPDPVYLNKFSQILDILKTEYELISTNILKVEVCGKLHKQALDTIVKEHFRGSIWYLFEFYLQPIIKQPVHEFLLKFRPVSNALKWIVYEMEDNVVFVGPEPDLESYLTVVSAFARSNREES